MTKYILVLRLTNTGFVQLDENWSVILNLTSEPISDRSACSSLPSEHTHTYNTVVVQKSHPSLCTLNGFQEIHHSLPADVVSKLPLSVTLSLSYELGSMFTEPTHAESVESLKCVSIPFYCDRIDILHFVKQATVHTSRVVKSDTCARASQFVSEVEASLVQMARQRPTAWKMKEMFDCSGSEGSNQYSTSVRVTESTAKEIVGKGDIFYMFINQTISQNKYVSPFLGFYPQLYLVLMLHIFPGDVSEVKVLQALLPLLPDLKLPMIRLVTADGHQVVLSVTQFTDVQKQHNSYDIQIQCLTVSLLCQLRSAVSARVGNFIHNSPVLLCKCAYFVEYFFFFFG